MTLARNPIHQEVWVGSSQLKMKTYVKKYRKYYPKNKFTDLTRKEAVKLEVEIYNRLKGKDHFAKLLFYSGEEIILSYCGKSLNNVKKAIIKNPEKQIKKIHKALVDAKITHLDMCDSGKNICVLNGKIFLIDFDIAVIDGNPKTPKIKELYEKSKNINFTEKMRSIIYSKI